MSPRDPANSLSKERLLELAGDLCNGTISDADGRQLDLALRTDPQARTLYTNYMWLHGSLYGDAGELLHGRPAGTIVDAAPRGSVPAPHTPATAPEDSPRGIVGSRRRPGEGASRRWGFWAIAASLAGVATLSSLVTHQWRQLASRTAAPAAASVAQQPAEAAVARITGTHNCLWSRSAGAIEYGARLSAGQRLDLVEGLAEITFNDGATLLLEGPASLTIDSGDRAQLTAGRLAAVVPKRAHGFQVRTAALDVLEAGAEFGIIAQESGAAELHVFNGLLRAEVQDGQGRAFQSLELNDAQAARINPLLTTVTHVPADDALFARSILPSSGPHDGLLAYEGFRYPEGPLEAQNGGFGWAGPWFNIAADEAAGPDSNRVLLGSLTVEGLAPVGNHAALTAQKNRIRRSLATSVGGVFDTAGLVENQDALRLVGRDGKQVYISFLQRVDRLEDGFYGVEFHRGDGNFNRVLCVGNGADGTGYGATSNVNIYGVANFPSLGPENSEVNLIVIKITYGVEHRDLVEIYRNPESLSDESRCRVDAVLRGNFAFDRISLGNYDGKKIHEVDEIRIGTHFLAVTRRWGATLDRLQRRITFHPPQSPAFARRSGQFVLAMFDETDVGTDVAGERS